VIGSQGVFWQEIAQYKYLAPPNLRPLIDKYLEIKLGSAKMGNWDDPEYIESERSLTEAVRNRYNEIESKLSKL
jgi:hypothetical protein